MGRLLYLSNTRPNICYVVQHLSQIMQRPKRSHYEAAIRVVRYIEKDLEEAFSLLQQTLTTDCLL